MSLTLIIQNKTWWRDLVTIGSQPPYKMNIKNCHHIIVFVPSYWPQVFLFIKRLRLGSLKKGIRRNKIINQRSTVYISFLSLKGILILCHCWRSVDQTDILHSPLNTLQTRVDNLMNLFDSITFNYAPNSSKFLARNTNK